MKKYQAKSPCCNAKVDLFGGRRRRCRFCKKTWRIRRKKLGRKKKTINQNLVLQFLEHSVPIQKVLALKRKVSESTVQRDMATSLDRFLKETPWPEVPQDESLIAIADAMVVYKDNKWQTIYFILVRPVGDKDAVILPPYHRLATEVVKGWSEAFSQVPTGILSRIKALVCDGHVGLVCVARERKWLIQRCHFHLISRIQSRRSKWGFSRHYEEGKHIYELVKSILTTKDEKLLIKNISIVEEIGWGMKSKDLKRTLLGFVTHVDDFRTFLKHPELHLPTTSNTAESLIGYIQSISKRAKGFRTFVSMQKWIFATIKYKKIIKCNGYFQPS